MFCVKGYLPMARRKGMWVIFGREKHKYLQAPSQDLPRFSHASLKVWYRPRPYLCSKRVSPTWGIPNGVPQISLENRRRGNPQKATHTHSETLTWGLKEQSLLSFPSKIVCSKCGPKGFLCLVLVYLKIEFGPGLPECVGSFGLGFPLKTSLRRGRPSNRTI